MEPVGGLGVRGGGLWHAGHGEQGRVALGGGAGEVPVRSRGWVQAEELHYG